MTEIKIFRHPKCRLETILTSDDHAHHTLEVTSPGSIVHLQFATNEVQDASRPHSELDANIESAKDPNLSPISMFPFKAFQMEEPALYEDQTCIRFQIPSGASFRFLIPLKLIPRMQQELSLALQRGLIRANATKQ